MRTHMNLVKFGFFLTFLSARLAFSQDIDGWKQLVGEYPIDRQNSSQTCNFGSDFFARVFIQDASTKSTSLYVSIGHYIVGSPGWTLWDEKAGTGFYNINRGPVDVSNYIKPGFGRFEASWDGRKLVGTMRSCLAGICSPFADKAKLVMVTENTLSLKWTDKPYKQKKIKYNCVFNMR
jgi:hypothetical protein